MPSPDLSVQVKITPFNRETSLPSGDTQIVFVEVPSARIDRYRKDFLDFAKDATDKEIAEYLASQIAPYLLARAPNSYPPPWLIDPIAIPQLPSGIEARQPDIDYNGMKAWTEQ
jgi:hypothetical protein